MTTVTAADQVLLNAIRYKVKGRVSHFIASKFAQKQVTGDYELSSQEDVSEWGISDQTGGLLVQNMDEDKDGTRHWWGDLITDVVGHFTLPRRAVAIAQTYTWTAFDSFTDASADWDNETNLDDEDTATDATCHADDGVWSDYLECEWAAAKTLGSVRYWTDEALIGTAFDKIDIDYWDGAWKVVTNETPPIASRYVEFKVDAADVTKIRIRCHCSGGGDRTYAVGELTGCVKGAGADAGTIGDYEEFNNCLYVSRGAILYVLNSAGDGFIPLHTYPADIVALKASLNSKLYIYLGDTENYWYMTTAEVIATSDKTDATLDAQWDSKLIKMNAAGEGDYSTAPDATPWTWSTTGDITDLNSGDIKHLLIYFDADGNDKLYAATKKGLKILDFANAKWLDTALELGNHPNGGKGAIRWQDALYVSAGLSVQRYVAGQQASIAEVGLGQNAGLPAEYNGEIVKLFGANNTYMFACVDSTQSGGTSTSCLFAYDGRSWKCWWVGDATEDAMVGGIVSSAYGYKAWFDHNSTIYSITIPRGIQNTTQVATPAYELNGEWISGVFDANWVVGNKLAIGLKAGVYGDVSADETVIVSYRTDAECDSALASDWTAFTTIVAAGVTSFTFAAGVGETFKRIQFKLALARKAADTDESPDVQFLLFTYRKLIPIKWGWTFVADCTKPYDGYSPEQMLDALKAAAETETLLAFVTKDTTYYVTMVDVQDEQLTGEGDSGFYKVTVREF